MEEFENKTEAENKNDFDPLSHSYKSPENQINSENNNLENKKKSLKKVPEKLGGLILIVLTFLIVFTSVYFYKHSENFHEINHHIAKKIKLGSNSLKFIPKKSFLVININKLEENNIIIEIFKKLPLSDLDLIKEIINVFTDSKSHKSDISLAVFKKENKFGGIFAGKIFNQEKYEKFINLFDKNKYVANGKINNKFAFQKKGDFFLLSTDKKFLNKIVTQNLKENINNNFIFKKAKSSFSKSASINSVFLLGNIFQEKCIFDFASLEFFPLKTNSANQQKYDLKGKIVLNEKNIDLEKIDFTNLLKENENNSLLKNISSKNLLLALEINNLANITQTVLEIIKINDLSKWEKINAKKTQIEKSLALSLENDIYPWNKEKFILALYKRNKNFDFSLLFDAKKAPQKSKQVLEKVYQIAKMWFDLNPTWQKKVKSSSKDDVFSFTFQDLPAEYKTFHQSTLQFNQTQEDLIKLNFKKNSSSEESFAALKIPLKFIKNNLLIFYPALLSNKLNIKNIIFSLKTENSAIEIEGTLETAS